VDSGGQDPEISQISLSTNFLRGRTSGQDPRDPKKVVRTPGFPKKVVRTPGFPKKVVRTPRSRESGVWTPGNRVPETAVFPGSGGGEKK